MKETPKKRSLWKTVGDWLWGSKNNVIMDIVDLGDLYGVIEEQKFLVIGCPLKVGISTFMSEYLAQKLFTEEGYYALVLTKDQRDKVTILNQIELILKGEFGYGEKVVFDSSTSSIIEKGQDLNGRITVLDYNANEKANNSEKPWDLVYVDKDIGSEHLNARLDVLERISKKMIVATYDFQDSIYYKIDPEYKIRLISNYALLNQAAHKKSPSTVINKDRLVYGLFEEQ